MARSLVTIPRLLAWMALVAVSGFAGWPRLAAGILTLPIALFLVWGVAFWLLDIDGIRTAAPK